MSETVTDETVNLDHMECRDIQISCIAAKSLAGPSEACRPQEGLKLEAPKYLGILLTVYFGTPSMFITLWFGFDYGTNPPVGTLII
jgi:hypothetical protein